MAPTKDFTGAVCLPTDGVHKHFVMKNTVDFSQSGKALAQNETGGIFDVPAGVMVERVVLNVKTPQADITDIDVGIDGGTADGFVDGADISTAGYKTDIDEGYTPTAGYLSGTDSIIAVKNLDAQTLNAAVIEFIAVCKDLR